MTLTPDRFRRLEREYHRALELDPPAREELYRELEEEDADLARDVRELVALSESDILHTSPDPVLDASALVGRVAPGERIGEYRIASVVASGGMGTVYRAEQERPRRDVALKVMRAGFTSASSLRRFELEAEILARLEHPGIALIHQAGLHESETGPVPYLAMEFIEGVDVITHARERGLGRSERIRLVIAICEAAQHAHQKGVVHRDIKPSNILVNAAGHPKLVDFGVARALDGDLDLTTPATGVGQIVGTVSHMSPEQTTGDASGVDTRADVYAIGVVLYQLLTGRLPFRVDDRPLVDVLRAIQEDEPAPPSRHDPTLRGDLDTILAKALEKEPDRRYAAASALAADLARHLDHEPIEARPASTTYKVGKFVRRNPVFVGLVSLIFVGLVCGVILISAQKRRADSEAEARASALQEVQRLSDMRRLRDLEAEERTLWPAIPEKAKALDDWLDAIAALIARLPDHRATLARLSSEKGADGQPVFATFADRWQHDILADLVRELEAYATPDNSTIASVRARRAFAGDVARRTLEEPAAAWQRDVAAVRGSPRYGGLELTPQLGLIPLGPDPRSGLHEYLHLQTHDGPLPARGEDGRFDVTAGTGLILVLLPAGTFRMGAHTDIPDTPSENKMRQQREKPPHEVTLDAFFLSRYEMTQAQWQRVSGTNPSMFTGDKVPTIGAHHPVEQVSWIAAERMAFRLGLVLPTEARWEYAARAGTETAWWTGNDRELLRGKMNIADRAAVKMGFPFPGARDWPDFDDGHAYHAPVGSFPPNPWGLHDMQGNVMEWCLERFLFYDRPVRAKDGLREGEGRDHRILRGGSFISSYKFTRSSHRIDLGPDVAGNFTGLRPARPVE